MLFSNDYFESGKDNIACYGRKGECKCHCQLGPVVDFPVYFALNVYWHLLK